MSAYARAFELKMNAKEKQAAPKETFVFQAASDNEKDFNHKDVIEVLL